MGTDKTDPLKQETQVSFLSVLVVKFDEGLEIVSSSMSASLPLWLKFFFHQHEEEIEPRITYFKSQTSFHS
jgi:hypothetical protein